MENLTIQDLQGAFGAVSADREDLEDTLFRLAVDEDFLQNLLDTLKNWR